VERLERLERTTDSLAIGTAGTCISLKRLERSKAVERLEPVERTDPHLELSVAVERLEPLELAS
jgi:hypothetical protein